MKGTCSLQSNSHFHRGEGEVLIQLQDSLPATCFTLEMLRGDTGGLDKRF
jgi:hypothetical protein